MLHSLEANSARLDITARSAEASAPSLDGGGMVSLRRTVRHQHPPREVPLWWREWRARFEWLTPRPPTPTGGTDMQAQPGQPNPLGATLMREGVNFSVYARGAESLSLRLFEHADDAEPSHTFTLNPQAHRHHHYWHVWVPGLRAGQLYGWCADGPHEPARGMRFDNSKLLLDPYGRAVAMPQAYSRDAAACFGRHDAQACKSVVTDMRAYDWQGDAPLRRPFAQTVIYEMHVGGFTRHPSSGLAPGRRGTFAGLVDKIPYLSISASPPSNCCPCSSSTPGRAGRAEQLLGLLADVILRATCRLWHPAPASADGAGRVP
jgi:hypothetical protein